MGQLQSTKEGNCQFNEPFGRDTIDSFKQSLCRCETKKLSPWNFALQSVADAFFPPFGLCNWKKNEDEKLGKTAGYWGLQLIVFRTYEAKATNATLETWIF